MNQGCDLGIVQGVRKDEFGFNGFSKGARRYAPGLNDGALPRTPDSFTLSAPRIAGLGIICGVCCRGELSWGASRWLSASRRWRCRPSQRRIGLSNRFPGFWSDRTPLAHEYASLFWRGCRISPVFKKHVSALALWFAITWRAISVWFQLSGGDG